MTKRTARPRRITIRDYLKNPTAAAYGALLVQGSVALYKTEGKRISRDEVIAAVLRSFGITRPKD